MLVAHSHLHVVVGVQCYYVGVELECHRPCPSQTVLALEFF